MTKESSIENFEDDSSVTGVYLENYPGAGLFLGFFTLGGCGQAQQVVEKTTQSIGDDSSEKNNNGDDDNEDGHGDKWQGDSEGNEKQLK